MLATADQSNLPSLMPRRILHHGNDPSAAPTLLGDRAISGCWFEWQRWGGCGAGELRLRDEFADRGAIQPGDWISIETAPGLRWYLGRVESKAAMFPSGLRFRLEGMAIEMNEVFPGGFGPEMDGWRPQRFGASDRFSDDPDRHVETFDSLTDAVALVRLLIGRYVEGRTHISYLPARVESSLTSAPLDSLKVRGEETIRSLVKELAVRARGASWGVDAAGEFFFLRPRIETALTLRVGRDITSLEERSDRELLFNRVLLTGDYVYDRQDYSGELARRMYRWRGNFVQPDSRATYGDRRLRIWLPWIRTQADSLAFVREFFRTFSQPARQYEVTTGTMTAPSFPWLGAVRLESSAGEEIASGMVSKVRITFDRTPRMQLTIGPEDPRTLWPEPPHDERWELPDRRALMGGEVSLTEGWPGNSSGAGGGGSAETSTSSGEEGGSEAPSSHLSADSASSQASATSASSADSADSASSAASLDFSDFSGPTSTWDGGVSSLSDSSAESTFASAPDNSSNASGSNGSIFDSESLTSDGILESSFGFSSGDFSESPGSGTTDFWSNELSTGTSPPSLTDAWSFGGSSGGGSAGGTTHPLSWGPSGGGPSLSGGGLPSMPMSHNPLPSLPPPPWI